MGGDLSVGSAAMSGMVLFLFFVEFWGFWFRGEDWGKHCLEGLLSIVQSLGLELNLTLLFLTY